MPDFQLCRWTFSCGEAKSFVMCKLLIIAACFGFALMGVVSQLAAAEPSAYSRFVGLADFSKFTRSQNEKGEAVWLPPEIKSAVEWNELIVSWNADAPAGSY